MLLWPGQSPLREGTRRGGVGTEFAMVATVSRRGSPLPTTGCLRLVRSFPQKRRILAQHDMNPVRLAPCSLFLVPCDAHIHAVFPILNLQLIADVSIVVNRQSESMAYRSISDYGVIGNRHSAALVS